MQKMLALSRMVQVQQLTKNQISQSVQVQLQMVQENLKHLVQKQTLHYLVALHVKRVQRLP